MKVLIQKGPGKYLFVVPWKSKLYSFIKNKTGQVEVGFAPCGIRTNLNEYVYSSFMHPGKKIGRSLMVRMKIEN